MCRDAVRLVYYSRRDSRRQCPVSHRLLLKPCTIVLVVAGIGCADVCASYVRGVIAKNVHFGAHIVRGLTVFVENVTNKALAFGSVGEDIIVRGVGTSVAGLAGRFNNELLVSVSHVEVTLNKAIPCNPFLDMYQDYHRH